MNEERVYVEEILNSWCSCGCCVPFGEGNGEMSEAHPDMHRVSLTNGVKADFASPLSVGDEVYFDEQDDDWYLCL